MNKINSELLEKEITRFVHETKGVFSKNVDSIWFSVFGANVPIEMIQRHARELGYINGFRWGVEYPTNGEMPDLPDDVNIQYWTSEFGRHAANVISLNWSHDSDKCYPATKFKITDQRYKPLDTSYLDAVSEISESKCESENVSDWYDYEAQKAVALPPVGVECAYLNKITNESETAFIVSADFFDSSAVIWRSSKHSGELYYGYKNDFRPLDHNRKAEAEKNKVANDAFYAFLNHPGNALHAFKHLYDLGYLRAPAN